MLKHYEKLGHLFVADQPRGGQDAVQHNFVQKFAARVKDLPLGKRNSADKRHSPVSAKDL